MGASIKDIAKACNLSVSTVSRALNDQYGVSESAKKKVMEKAQELGYVPNISAKELVSKKSNLIGLILHGDDYEVRPAFLEHLPYINKTLNLYGKDTIICTLSRNSYESGDLTRTIQKRNFEGCIVFPGFLKHHQIFKDIAKLDSPMVVLEEKVISRSCSNINTDDVLGGELATKHLIANGHSKIGFINGPLRAYVSEQRLIGYKKALADAGIPLIESYVMESDYTGEGGAKCIVKLLDQHPEISAVFFANDMMAMGAISQLHKHGVNVPDDLSVVGYDGVFVTPYFNPPLTTVQIDYQGIGIRAAELMIELLHGGKGRSTLVPPKLIERESVKTITSM